MAVGSAAAAGAGTGCCAVGMHVRGSCGCAHNLLPLRLALRRQRARRRVGDAARFGELRHRATDRHAGEVKHGDSEEADEAEDQLGPIRARRAQLRIQR